MALKRVPTTAASYSHDQATRSLRFYDASELSKATRRGHSRPPNMSFFKPARNADFLRSRTLFFVVILVLHFVFGIVAALDVAAKDTRRTHSHLGVSVYNLIIQLVCFAAVAAVARLDTQQHVGEQHAWFSHTFFEIVLYAALAVLQLAGALAYSALSPTFQCGSNIGSACASAYRALLVGSWTITILYVLFALWFTASVVVASKRDPTVWRRRCRSYDWEGNGHTALISPLSPVDVVIAEKQVTSTVTSTAASPVKPKKTTWVLPTLRQGPRPRLESTPHLPIQSLPPPTPYSAVPPTAGSSIPPVPELPLEHRQQHMTLHLSPIPQDVPEDISLSGTPAAMRPVSLVQSIAQRQRAMIMSIKPLRLGHSRARTSVDKSMIGQPRAQEDYRDTMDSKYAGMTLTAAEATFPNWWNAESTFAPPRSTFQSGTPSRFTGESSSPAFPRSTLQSNNVHAPSHLRSQSYDQPPATAMTWTLEPPGFSVARTVSSRYSTGTTVPPTPPPKDKWRLPALELQPAIDTGVSSAQSNYSNQSRSNSQRHQRAMSPTPRSDIIEQRRKMTSPKGFI